MPEQNIIDVSWDLAKFDEQTQEVLKDMQAVYDLGKEISKQKISLGSTGGFKELKEAVDNTNNLTDAQKKLIETQKQAAASAVILAKEKARLAQLSTDEAKQLAEVKIQQQEQVKANREVAKSVLGLVDDYGLLKKEYNEAAAAAKNLASIALRTGDANDISAAATATAKAKALHDSLLQIEQGVGQSQRNVGNYTGALKILETALGDAKAKLDGMTQAEQQNTSAGQKLQHEIALLSTLAGEQSQGFASLRREVMNATQALATMESQGLEHTEAFKQLQTEVANSKRGLNEFVEQQKLLASESPAIAGLTAAAKGLGAAYAIGAGASALFAEGNEKVEKELNKLVAVMTLLQGLSEVNKTLQDRTAIATSLRGVKEAILNGILAIRNFILTGSIKAQTEASAAEVESIAVKEADAVATTEVAVATTAAGVAMTVFRTALIATGIGAIVVLLTAAVIALVEFANKTDEAATSTEEFKLQVDRLQESLTDETEAIEFNTKRQIEYLKQKGATEREQVDRKILGDKYLAEAYAKTADEQIAKAKEVAAEYGITIKGSVKTAEDAKKILETLQDVKASNPEYEDLGKKQKEAFEGTIDTFKKIYDNFKHIQKLNNEDELALEELKTREMEKKRKKHETVVNESTKEALDVEFELYKIAQNRKIKLLDEGANDAKKSFGLRMLLAQDYAKASAELIERTSQHEINLDKIKLAELESNFKKAKGTERNNLAIEIENEKKAILIATAKKNDELLGVEEAFQKRQTQIAKDEEAARLKAFDDAAKSIANVRVNQGGAIEAIRDTEKASHDKLLQEKTISQEKYDKLEAKSINDNLILSLQADLRKEESLRALAVLQQKSTTDIDNAITAITAKIQSAKSQYATDSDNKKDAEALQKRDTIVSLAKEATDALTSLVDIGYQKEIDAIQKIIDLNNQRKDQEIANINASTLSAQEKAAQLIILDKTVAANNHKLLVQQNQERVKQAKFDRDMAIIKILEDVAGANFKLIAQGGFAGIAAGIAVGLQATAAIASLLAKPLPTVPAYAKGVGIPGRGEHPGGPAVVGEAGKELVEMNGRSFITSGPMLMNNLPKGSRVIPLTSDDIMTGMSGGAAMAMAQRYSQVQVAEAHNREVVDAIRETGRMTVQAMKKQKGNTTTIIINGGWDPYINKTVRT